MNARTQNKKGNDFCYFRYIYPFEDVDVTSTPANIFLLKVVSIDTESSGVLAGQGGGLMWPCICKITQRHKDEGECAAIKRRSPLCGMSVRWRKTELIFTRNRRGLARRLHLAIPLGVEPKVRKQTARCKLANLGRRDLT